MSGDQSRLFSTQFENSHTPPIVCHRQSLPPRHDLEGSEFERSCALVAIFALVRERLVEALGHIDVLCLPPVTEMSPDIDTQI